MTSSEALSLVQGSPAWRQARVGYVTASRAGDVIATLKRGGESKERANYRMELICERLTGIPYDSFVTREMQWGLDHEAEARCAYEIEKDVLVDQVGFVIHPTIENFGCSPDGLVNDDGLLQIKCPTKRTHLEWWQAGILPIEYAPQLLAELSCHPERRWIDFASYHPDFREHLQLFVRRFDRDEKLIAALEEQVRHFNQEIDQVLRALPHTQPIAQVLEMPIRDEMDF
jgi:hypothetical protein